jgi:hypothetical protein
MVVISGGGMIKGEGLGEAACGNFGGPRQICVRAYLPAN